MGRMKPEDVKQFIGKVCEVEWLDHRVLKSDNSPLNVDPVVCQTFGRVENIRSYKVAGHDYYYILMVHEYSEDPYDRSKSFEGTLIMLDDITWFQPYVVEGPATP